MYKYIRKVSTYLDKMNIENRSFKRSCRSKNRVYYKDGTIKEIKENGDQLWTKDGKFHRDHWKPAKIYADNNYGVWYRNGKLCNKVDREGKMIIYDEYFTQIKWCNSRNYLFINDNNELDMCDISSIIDEYRVYCGNIQLYTSDKFFLPIWLEFKKQDLIKSFCKKENINSKLFYENLNKYFNYNI